MVAVGGIGVLEGTGVGADSGISVGAEVEVDEVQAAKKMAISTRQMTPINAFIITLL
jgi:hypothetical protein